MDELTAEYAKGVDDYWAGMVPDHWDNPDIRERSAYLTGWYQASCVDNNPEWLLESEDTNTLDYDELMEKDML